MNADHPKCQVCKRIKAVWMYMPNDHEALYCDNCVPRGCSCNTDPETGEDDKDEQGRDLPCVEYLYDEKGFEYYDEDE